MFRARRRRPQGRDAVRGRRGGRGRAKDKEESKKGERTIEEEAQKRKEKAQEKTKEARPGQKRERLRRDPPNRTIRDRKRKETTPSGQGGRKRYWLSRTHFSHAARSSGVAEAMDERLNTCSPLQKASPSKVSIKPPLSSNTKLPAA